MASPRR